MNLSPISLGTDARLPKNICQEIIHQYLELTVAPMFNEIHECTVLYPCKQLKEAGRHCASLYHVCRAWRTMVKEEVTSSYEAMAPKVISYSDVFYGDLRSNHMFGYYRYVDDIERCSSTRVISAYDYSNEDSCHSRTHAVVLKLTKRGAHFNERDFYKWFETKRASMRDEDPDVPGFLGASALPNATFVIVLKRLGYDLNSLSEKKLFTPRQTMAVAIQALGIYHRFHRLGWLHCNAKPGNFVTGPPNVTEKKGRIYLVDFEFSRPVPETIAFGSEGYGWNHNFCSIEWHKGTAPSFRDDLEGLGYMLAFLGTGALPWYGSWAPTRTIGRMKSSTETSKLFSGMDPVYIKYFETVRGLSWGEKPDYDALLKDFTEVWDSGNYGCTPYEVDWEKEFLITDN